MSSPYDYFEYKGKKYGVGTIIRGRSDLKVDGYWYDKFFGKDNNTGKYIFFPIDYHIGYKIEHDKLQKWEIEIVEPHGVGEFAGKGRFTSKGKATSYIDYSIGWMWYIVAMVVSLLFKDFITAWFGITLAFIVWRKKKRGE